MADISMCTGKTCPIQNNCYRFIAIPTNFKTLSGKRKYWQSYFSKLPYDFEKKACPEFWKATDQRKAEKVEWEKKVKAEDAEKKIL